MKTDSLRAGIAAVAVRIEEDHQTFNELDGRFGDGDLGLTLLKAFRELEATRAELPEDVGLALMRCASSISKVSSSSYGTLMATGFLAAGKACKGQTEVDWPGVPDLMQAALEAVMARGKASLGDKTVVDALHAATEGARGHNDPAAMLQAARAGVAEALDRLRNEQSKLGRARIFAERTVGADDPGMLAFQTMLEALGNTTSS